MKKLTVCVIALFAAMSIAGCGNMRVDTPAATTMPYVTPTPDDGIVTDRDGIIDNNNPQNDNTERRTTGTVDMGKDDITSKK